MVRKWKWSLLAIRVQGLNSLKGVPSGLGFRV